MNNNGYTNAPPQQQYGSPPPPQPYGSPPPQFQQYPTEQQQPYHQEHGITSPAQHPRAISQYPQSAISKHPQDLKQPQVQAVSAAPSRIQSTQLLPSSSVPHPSHNHAQHWTPPNGPTQQWNNTMCGCFDDVKICCLGTWCPCMLYARTYRRLRSDPSELGPGFNHCNTPAILWYCCGGGLTSARQRSEIRYRYNLEGSECSDHRRHCWCGPCTLCQEEREVASREATKKNQEAQQPTVGYETQRGMSYN